MRNFKIILVIALATISLLYSCGDDSTNSTENKSITEASITEFAPDSNSEYAAYAIDKSSWDANKYICRVFLPDSLFININDVKTKFTNSIKKYDETYDGIKNLKFENQDYTLIIKTNETKDDPYTYTGTMELTNKSGVKIKKDVYRLFQPEGGE